MQCNDKRRRLWRILCLAFGLSGVSLTLQAHPHSFIDMRTTVESRDDKITGLRMHWVMDPITSADLLYDAGQAPADSEIWKKLAAEVMANVLGQHYFTDIYRAGRAVKYAPLPETYRLSRQGNQAVLEFVLPLAVPQPLAGEPLLISTYDPSWFVDMTYRDQQAIGLSDALRSRCQAQLFTPKPDATLLDYAQSLDKQDAPDEDIELGKQFAQRITLQCH